LLYFEIVSTCALIIGIIVANIIRPGNGVVSKIAADASKLASYQKAAADMHWLDFLTHIIHPIYLMPLHRRHLQVCLSPSFWLCPEHAGRNGQPVTSLFETLSKVFFGIMRM